MNRPQTGDVVSPQGLDARLTQVLQIENIYITGTKLTQVLQIEVLYSTSAEHK